MLLRSCLSPKPLSFPTLEQGDLSAYYLPVYHKNIPINVRNTFHPEETGTLIRNIKPSRNGKIIKVSHPLTIRL